MQTHDINDTLNGAKNVEMNLQRLKDGLQRRVGLFAYKKMQGFKEGRHEDSRRPLKRYF